MLGDTIIQKMKRTNISADPEKTKQRVEELWKGAAKEEKAAVENLAGVERSTVARICKAGGISAKLAVALSQTLNADPFYLTGESDKRGEYARDSLQSFLEKHGYAELLSEQDKLDRKAARKMKTVQEPPEDNKAGAEENVEEEIPQAPPQTTEEYVGEIKQSEPTAETAPGSVQQAFLDNLEEEDMILLMRSILLRAKAGGKNAELAQKMKLLLLS